MSEENNKIAFLCRKLKREGMIANTYSANGIIHLSCNKISNERIQKVPHLNSITAQSFSKLSQLKDYISTYKHDFICLSETYLDSSTPNNLIDIEGYKLVRSDHPDNNKRGGVCIYYKEALPVRVINSPFFKEALLLEMCYNKKKKKSDCVRNLSFPKPK